jgi:hypothetical protein
MARFVLSYRVPQAYTPGQPEAVAAWTGWFESMGACRVDRGHGVIESGSLGNIGPGTRLGGYSVVIADDLDAAVAVATGCPTLALGGGVEVGAIAEVSQRPRPVAAD